MSYFYPTKIFAAATLLGVSLSQAQDPILDDIIAYYPFDVLEGTSTPDLVNGYNMAGRNVSSDDLITGQFGNAFQFDATNQIFTREHAFDTSGAIPVPLDELPLEQHTNFSISFWVNDSGENGNADARLIAEASLSNTSILFGLGRSPQNSSSDRFSLFIRAATTSASGGVEINHSISNGTAYDGTWHHLVYVQEGDVATVYLDGVVQSFIQLNNPDLATPLDRTSNPVRPLNGVNGNIFTNVTSIGALQRTSAGGFFRGSIDDVGMWSRALTAAEALRLSTEKIPDPAADIPLSLSAFASQRPTSRVGGTAILTWQGSADDTYTLNPGAMDVSGMTTGGFGKISVPITEATTYELTVSRDGEDPITLSTSVGVLADVADGWALLGNFETFSVGKVAVEAAPFWKDPSNGRQWDLVEVEGNLVATGGPGFIGAMSSPLDDYSIEGGDTRTVFFHVYSPITADDGLYRTGVTSKTLRGFSSDLDSEGGPDSLGAYLDILSGGNIPDTLFTTETSDFEVEEAAGKWTAVWMDVTNTESGRDVSNIYTQVSDATERVLIVENSEGDSLDSAATLETFYIGARDTNTADKLFYIDNIFISEDTAVLGTLPVAFPPAPPIIEEPTVLLITSVTFEGGTVAISWNGDAAEPYTVESSTDLINWTEITDGSGATGNSFSDTPAVENTTLFYRVSEQD